MTITQAMATCEALDLCENHTLPGDIPTNSAPKHVRNPMCDECGTCENVAEYLREMGPELHNGEPVLWGVVPLWAPEEDAVPASKPTAKPAAKRVPRAKAKPAPKPAPKRKPAAKRERKIVKPHVTPKPAAKRKPAPKRKPAANASGLTPKQVANRALAAALVSAGKEKTGPTWAAARDAVKAGKTIAQAVAMA